MRRKKRFVLCGAHNVELCATANSVQGQLSDALEVTMQAHNEVEALRNRGGSGASNNAVVQEDVALRLAAAAVQIQELTVELGAARTTAAEAGTVVERSTEKVTAMTTEVICSGCRRTR